MKRALSEAEVIVLGPGSLFTSVMPNLLLTEMAALLRDVKVPIIYIANLMTQPKETEGMNIVAHVDWIASILGAVPDYILANQSAIPEEFVTRYASIGAEPLYLYGDYCEIKNGKYLRHNAKHLSETIMEIVRGNRKN